MRIAFKAYGVPVPQGSMVCMGKRGTVRHVVVDSKQKTLLPWKDAIRSGATAAMNGHEPVTGPVVVALTFTVPRPASIKPDARPWPHVKGPGDLDKLVRAVLDAMTGPVYLDDAQVVAAPPYRAYPDSPALPHALAAVLPPVMPRPGVFVIVTTL